MLQLNGSDGKYKKQFGKRRKKRDGCQKKINKKQRGKATGDKDTQGSLPVRQERVTLKKVVEKKHFFQTIMTLYAN